MIGNMSALQQHRANSHLANSQSEGQRQPANRRHQAHDGQDKSTVASHNEPPTQLLIEVPSAWFSGTTDPANAWLSMDIMPHGKGAKTQPSVIDV